MIHAENYETISKIAKVKTSDFRSCFKTKQQKLNNVHMGRSSPQPVRAIVMATGCHDDRQLVARLNWFNLGQLLEQLLPRVYTTGNRLQQLCK